MTLSIPAEPYDFTFDPVATALLIIYMQRDFVDGGGFGELLGNDVAPLREVIAPIGRVLAAWRARAAGDPHPRGPPARPERLPAQQALAQQAHRRRARS
jgi:hypothetical protein